MKQERRTFTKEFKLNAVELSYSRKNIVELANDVKKRKNIFMRVKNPKTNKFEKGYYKLKPSHISKTNLKK